MVIVINCIWEEMLDQNWYGIFIALLLTYTLSFYLKSTISESWSEVDVSCFRSITTLAPDTSPCDLAIICRKSCAEVCYSTSKEKLFLIVLAIYLLYQKNFR